MLPQGNPKEGRSADERSFLCIGARITTSVLCTLVSPAVACFLYVMGLADVATSLSLAVIPALLGIIWSPDLQGHILDPTGSNPLCHKRFRVLYGVVKVMAIVFFILVEMYFRSDVSQADHLLARYLQGFVVLQQPDILLPLVVHFLTSLVGLGLSYVSLALCQPLFGMVIPSLLSMVTSLVLCVYIAPSIYAIDETIFFGAFSPYLISASILGWAWAWPYILNSSSFLRRPRHLLTPYKILFKSYGWNPIFTDQKWLLGYDPKLTYETDCFAPKAKNRIYICTTMYREADYEMERLLLSLMKISSDPLLKDIHFESNIFMDNGCTGVTLNEFALQFLALLVSKGGVSLDRAKCWRTPYGLQIFCQLPSGLPLFVHLKDPTKVKSKKRWSQAMYINYVMRFRKVLWKNDSENVKIFTTGTLSGLTVTSMSKAVLEGGDAKCTSENEEFMLSQITSVGYPTLAEFRILDNACTSVDDSTPPSSESGSQVNSCP